jgi:Flp pilus assembly pilin Flp
MNAFLKNDSGAAGVEYGILIAAISAVIIVIAMSVGEYVGGAFQAVETGLADAGIAKYVAPAE